MLYCIVGPSGSGKSTIVEKLNQMGYKSPNSYTTRPKRFPEETGHTFITDEEFDKLENIVAYTIFNGYKYCTTEKMLKDCNLYIIDPNGVETLKKSKYIDFKVIGLILKPNECASRMLNRGDNSKEVTKRLKNDSQAFKNLEEICDYKIDASKNIDDIINQILEIIS